MKTIALSLMLSASAHAASFTLTVDTKLLYKDLTITVLKPVAKDSSKTVAQIKGPKLTTKLPAGNYELVIFRKDSSGAITLPYTQKFTLSKNTVLYPKIQPEKTQQIPAAGRNFFNQIAVETYMTIVDCPKAQHLTLCDEWRPGRTVA